MANLQELLFNTREFQHYLEGAPVLRYIIKVENPSLPLIHSVFSSWYRENKPLREVLAVLNIPWQIKDIPGEWMTEGWRAYIFEVDPRILGQTLPDNREDFYIYVNVLVDVKRYFSNQVMQLSTEVKQGVINWCLANYKQLRNYDPVYTLYYTLCYERGANLKTNDTFEVIVRQTQERLERQAKQEEEARLRREREEAEATAKFQKTLSLIYNSIPQSLPHTIFSPWFAEPVVLNGFAFAPLNRESEFVEAGRQMRNCIEKHGYYRASVNRSVIVYTMKDRGEYIAAVAMNKIFAGIVDYSRSYYSWDRQFDAYFSILEEKVKRHLAETATTNSASNITKDALAILRGYINGQGCPPGWSIEYQPHDFRVKVTNLRDNMVVLFDEQMIVKELGRSHPNEAAVVSHVTAHATGSPIVYNPFRWTGRRG